MGTTVSAELLNELEALGAPRSSVHELDRASAKNVSYLDLTRGVSVSWSSSRRVQPTAVVEYERKPILYVVDSSSLAGGPEGHAHEVEALRTRLACRGDVAWLAVRKPGVLTIYSLGLGSLPEGVTVEPAKVGRPTFIQDLAIKGWGALDARASQQAAIGQVFHDVLLKLVTNASTQLLASPALVGRVDDVLSLVGRALFARFLVDRGIMNRTTFPDFPGDHVTCFDNAKNAAQTCRWLDHTFNGELLELSSDNYAAFFSEIERVDDRAFEPLARILFHAPDGQLLIRETWGDIDFAHVPAGLLSEVYEQFAHAHGPVAQDKDKTKLAKAESIHYTPRSVAGFILDQAFDAIRTRAKNEARILDPAAGGGVFLVLALRRLVAAEWEANGRPTRKRLREILYGQLRGFDINNSALKLAALSLYLTALELDPDTDDLQDIAFDPMIGHVLLLTRGPEEAHPNSFVLGSLGPTVTSEHDQKYDLTISNPPWTSWKGDAAKRLNLAVKEIVKRVAAARSAAPSEEPTLLDRLSRFKNADARPDLAFVWRAMEWTVDNGVIAFALHARLLFNREGTGADARNALFSALRVTGILNGTALRNTAVWPNVTAQWCLLFAHNRVPRANDAFHFLSPQIESGLNESGTMRVDYASATPVEFARLSSQPDLLKILFRGTSLDADLLAKLRRRNLPTLKAYWQGEGLMAGEGYKVAGDNPKPAPEMQGWPDLRKSRKERVNLGFSVDVAKLDGFDHDEVERARDPGIYDPPLLVLPVSIQYQRDNGVGFIFRERVAYSESFFGYSAAQLREGASHDLVRYLHVLTASALFIYNALMTSSQFGIERETLQKEDVDSFPVMPLSALTKQQLKWVRLTSLAIEMGKCPWDVVDECVADIYGLSKADQQVIKDTLSVSLTYSDRRDAAERPPTAVEIRSFVAELGERLQAHFSIVNAPVRITFDEMPNGAWCFLNVTCGNQAVEPWLHRWLIELGRQSGSTQIFAEAGPGHLGIAMLAQYRYWTLSRARLCARTVISQHSDHLLRNLEAVVKHG
ncbi:N-6 DNA Methylase [Variovorax sp. YR750]|uniref:N-6 DNA methylase n=1 Tax=Variovorax sp. YR750 TaxID=1884384 RepID=UPI0008CFFF09|nr:N-6 DNA methylase [Variovorax sp. YR750]SEM10110.1 N-6 DNA Methylase [Variovorax sp. YR750]